MTKWDVVFDGSSDPGSVRLGDTVVSAIAHFKSDDDARLFFGLLCELRNEAQDGERRVQRMKDAMRKAFEESNR